MLNNNDESIDTSTLSNFGVTFEKYNVPEFTTLGYSGYVDETWDGIVLTGVSSGTGNLIIPNQLGTNGEYKNVIGLQGSGDSVDISFPSVFSSQSSYNLTAAKSNRSNGEVIIGAPIGECNAMTGNYTSIYIPSTVVAIGAGAITGDGSRITSIVFEESGTWEESYPGGVFPSSGGATITVTANQNIYSLFERYVAWRKVL